MKIEQLIRKNQIEGQDFGLRITIRAFVMRACMTFTECFRTRNATALTLSRGRNVESDVSWVIPGFEDRLPTRGSSSQKGQTAVIHLQLATSVFYLFCAHEKTVSPGVNLYAHTKILSSNSIQIDLTPRSIYYLLSRNSIFRYLSLASMYGPFIIE